MKTHTWPSSFLKWPSGTRPFQKWPPTSREYIYIYTCRIPTSLTSRASAFSAIRLGLASHDRPACTCIYHPTCVLRQYTHRYTLSHNFEPCWLAFNWEGTSRFIQSQSRACLALDRRVCSAERVVSLRLLVRRVCVCVCAVGALERVCLPVYVCKRAGALVTWQACVQRRALQIWLEQHLVRMSWSSVQK